MVELGEYPHSAINLLDRPTKKQTTRMIKCECEDCGYVARTSNKWIEEAGAPLCPCNSEPMEIKPPKGDDDEEESDDE